MHQHPGEPGAQRWRRYTANNHEYALLLRHPQPRPWLVCVQRTEMGRVAAHVEAMYPVSTVYDGQALNVTTCLYADCVGFGYAAGREVVPDIET